MRTIDNRIWTAAISLFARKGFAATGIREIAVEAGLSVSAMYYYVDNKEDLLVEIMRNTQQRFVAAGTEVVDAFDDAATALAALVQLHVMVHAAMPLEARVVDTELRALGDDRLPEILSLRDEYDRLWDTVLRKGATDGNFDIANPTIARLALLEMCNGVSAWYSPGGPLTAAEVAAEFANLALAMVSANRDGSPIRAASLDLPKPDWFSSLVLRLQFENADGQ